MSLLPHYQPPPPFLDHKSVDMAYKALSDRVKHTKQVGSKEEKSWEALAEYICKLVLPKSGSVRFWRKNSEPRA